jgi:hypothetical protein
VLTDRIAPIGEARERLVERLRRAGGSELSGLRRSPRAGQ